MVFYGIPAPPPIRYRLTLILVPLSLMAIVLIAERHRVRSLDERPGATNIGVPPDLVQDGGCGFSPRAGNQALPALYVS
jgi:hypothetical protein